MCWPYMKGSHEMCLLSLLCHTVLDKWTGSSADGTVGPQWPQSYISRKSHFALFKHNQSIVLFEARTLTFFVSWWKSVLCYRSLHGWQIEGLHFTSLVLLSVSAFGWMFGEAQLVYIQDYDDGVNDREYTLTRFDESVVMIRGGWFNRKSR